jgi:hypothetical protein
MQQQTQRIDKNMPLLALDQFAGIESMRINACPPLFNSEREIDSSPFIRCSIERIKDSSNSLKLFACTMHIAQLTSHMFLVRASNCASFRFAVDALLSKRDSLNLYCDFGGESNTRSAKS